MYVQSDTLLLTDVFENFRNMCLKIYKIDPAKFLSDPGLAWQAAFKKIKRKLDLSTDINYGKNKECSYLQYWNVNNLYGWAMSQKLPVNDFEWIDDTSQFIKTFAKNYNEVSV